jgi:ABC-type polysaccharide/polyol phosphate export permease
MSRFFKDLRKYWNYTFYSAKSQLKTEVANSYLNWAWWVIEPFCFMLIYAFIFGYLLSNRGPFFNCHIFIGLLIWDFFNRCVKSSVGMVKHNKSIVSKVYLPKYTLIISDMIVNGFKMFICLLIAFGMLVAYRVPVDWHLIMIVPVLAVTVLFTFGCCTILMHIGVFVTDMSNVINIVLRAVFYLTGIFYNIETALPEQYAKLLLTFNPLAALTTGMRHAMLAKSMPDWVTLGLWTVLSIILTAIGVHTIYKNENTYVKVI